MKAREVVLVIVLIIVGLAIYGAREARFEFNWGDGDFRFGLYEEFDFEEIQTIAPPLPAAFRIDNSHGFVEIQGTDEDRVTFTFQKRIWRKNKKTAEDVSRKLKAVVAREAGRIVLSTNRADFRKTNFETSFKVRIPRRTAVDIDNSHGDVFVSFAGETSVTNNHGKVVASDISGGLTVKNDHGAVEVERVEAGCRLETTHDALTASGIKGDAAIANSHGRVRLTDITGKIELNTPYCRVDGQKLPGLLSIENSHENISLTQIGPVRIVARHSPVEIEDAQGDVDIQDSYALVKLDEIRGRVVVAGNSLEVSGRHIEGGEIHITSSHENITLSEFSAAAVIEIEHGNTFLTPSSLSFPLEVMGRYGDITLFWPAGEANPLEASTTGGDVDWKLTARPDVETKNGTSILKAFLKETGKPSIRLTTSYGTIRIQERVTR